MTTFTVCIILTAHTHIYAQNTRIETKIFAHGLCGLHLCRQKLPTRLINLV